jgi:transposase
MFPERLDDYITEDNSVRVIDVFIDSLDLSGLGFKTLAEKTGRPGYHASTMLKLYVYGYLNRVQSSRRLEREAQRNVELMWLLGRLAPDFKTIADFRKDNGKGIKSVCREFVLLCKKLGLLCTACVAVDGSKFKAVNNSDRAFSKNKIERRLKKLDESIDRYLKEIKRLDGEYTKESNNNRGRFKERLAKVKEETKRLKLIEIELLKSPDQQIALTDPDARIMATTGRNTVKVGYNVL